MRATHATIDLGAISTYADGVPHELFAELRRTEPVAWIDEPEHEGFAGGPGFWAVTCHADVTTVSKSPDVFSSWLGSVELRDPSATDLAAYRQMMVNIDPPAHTQMRAIVSKAFTPRMVGAMFDQVAAHADAIVTELEPGTEIDFVDLVSSDMPLRVLADVLGVPSEDRRLLYDWTNRLVGLGDEAHGGPASFRSAFVEMFEYAAALIDQKRARPVDDVWSTIVNAEIEGERLTVDELNRFFQMLVIAGNETTRNMLTSAVRLLDQHSTQWRQLRADPSLYPTAVEEVCRYRSPIIQFRRTATRDTELGGAQIREGDKVVMFYVSANRDETVFADPNQFDIRRAPNPHLAFGTGSHFCLGNSLARLEGKVLLERLFTRFPDLAVSGGIVRTRSNFINGIAAMPVQLGRAAS
jgi:cytochrome P450